MGVKGYGQRREGGIGGRSGLPTWQDAKDAGGAHARCRRDYRKIPGKPDSACGTWSEVFGCLGGRESVVAAVAWRAARRGQGGSACGGDASNRLAERSASGRH